MADSDKHSLRHRAQRCLAAKDPQTKAALTQEIYRQLLAGELVIVPDASIGVSDTPGMPDKPQQVAPRDLPRRSLGTEEGRAALVHAVAHIEFNAINLAWDAVCRFDAMPEAFYRDWARVANDEARHFLLVQKRLAQMAYQYGDFPAHGGLWEMAMKTAHSDLIRMALVPRVLEARGLDVTPGMMAKFEQQGDTATVAVLAVILREEVAHVDIGTRWFRWCCERDGKEPEATFQHLLTTYMRRPPRGPYNVEARLRAGFTQSELDWLHAQDD